MKYIWSTLNYKILILSALLAIAIFSVQDAHATLNNLDQPFCGTMGGSWDIPTNTCTITSQYTINVGNELVIPSGTNLVISNTVDNGISNSGIISNFGTITVSNSGSSTSIYNYNGTLTNSGTITISNTGGEGIFNYITGTITNNSGGIMTISNTGSSNGIINVGTITNNSGGIMTISNTGSSNGIYNGGTITNSGTINKQCFATYTGVIPTSGNPIVDVCAACLNIPASGTWTITISCKLDVSKSILNGNVIVQNNSVLTIPPGKTLDINFATNHLIIKSGSGVLIQSGGKIF
jgi:hypothetical protein